MALAETNELLRGRRRGCERDVRQHVDRQEPGGPGVGRHAEAPDRRGQWHPRHPAQQGGEAPRPLQDTANFDHSVRRLHAAMTPEGSV